jgi:hypothetical protein
MVNSDTCPRHARSAGSSAAPVALRTTPQVRKTPSWARSWANFSRLQLCSHRNAWDNFRLLGQPNTLLAAAAARFDPRRTAAARRAPGRASPEPGVRLAGLAADRYANLYNCADKLLVSTIRP